MADYFQERGDSLMRWPSEDRGSTGSLLRWPSEDRGSESRDHSKKEKEPTKKKIKDTTEAAQPAIVARADIMASLRASRPSYKEPKLEVGD